MVPQLPEICSQTRQNQGTKLVEFIISREVRAQAGYKRSVFEYRLATGSGIQIKHVIVPVNALVTQRPGVSRIAVIVNESICRQISRAQVVQLPWIITELVVIRL